MSIRPPTVPISCRECPVQGLTVCQPLSGQRLEIVQNFKKCDRILPAGTPLYRPGDPCGELYNLLDGWVSLYRILATGRRQILDFALPGAFIGYQTDLFGPMLHGAESLTDVAVCVFPRPAFPRLIEDHADLARRLIWLNARDTILAHNHLTNIACRAARSRVAHLLLELCIRARGGRPSNGDLGTEIPLTQHHIADALGLTNVYVSVTLGELRQEGLILFKNGRLQVLDPDRLAAVAGIDDEAAFLSMDHESDDCRLHAVAPAPRSQIGDMYARNRSSSK